MKAMGQRSWKAGTPLEALELPDPTPGANEVCVRVAAVSVNPVDWKMRTRGPLRLAARLVGPPLPFVPGIDFAGTVEAMGSDIRSVRVGDRVVGGTDFSRGQRGSYAERVIAREDQLCALPASVSFESAAALPVAGVTAWMALEEIGRLASRPAGATVLVLGASGGVGQFVVQLAKRRGARVVGVNSARNLDLVRSLGADVAIDYAADDVFAQAKPNGAFHIIVDCVGGYSAAACRALLAPGGRHIMVAGEGPRSFAQVLVPPFSSKAILGRATTARLRPLLDGIAEGSIRVRIAARFPLVEAEAAHALSQAGRATGKILLLQ